MSYNMMIFTSEKKKYVVVKEGDTISDIKNKIQKQNSHLLQKLVDKEANNIIQDISNMSEQQYIEKYIQQLQEYIDINKSKKILIGKQFVMSILKEYEDIENSK